MPGLVVVPCHAKQQHCTNHRTNQECWEEVDMAEQVERAYEVFIDLATGFYDRRTMWARLAEEIARARRYRYPLSLILGQKGQWHVSEELDDLGKKWQRGRSAISLPVDD